MLAGVVDLVMTLGGLSFDADCSLGRSVVAEATVELLSAPGCAAMPWSSDGGQRPCFGQQADWHVLDGLGWGVRACGRGS